MLIFFNFSKFRINGLEELINLHTCRVLFARWIIKDNPLNKIKLSLEDFNSEEIAENFRVCSVDPGRRDAFVSYHGNNDTRKLPTDEYYRFSGTLKRMRNEETRKGTEGIKEIETNMPSPKK